MPTKTAPQTGTSFDPFGYTHGDPPTAAELANAATVADALGCDPEDKAQRTRIKALRGLRPGLQGYDAAVCRGWKLGV